MSQNHEEQQNTPVEQETEPAVPAAEAAETPATAETPAVQDSAPEPEHHSLYPADDAKKSMRKFWLKTILMLLLIAASVGVMFGIMRYIPGAENSVSFRTLLKGVNVNFLLILIAVLVFYILVETFKYAYMLKVTTGKFRFRVSFKTMFLGKYYDGITPMNTGGQPFQIYYLHKKDINKGAATAIPLVRYLVSAFVVTVISVVLLIITPMQGFEQGVITTTMYTLSWVSIALNCIFPLVIVFFSAFPKKTGKLLTGIIKLLHKLHLVKKKEETIEKWIFELNEYSSAIKNFTKKSYELLPLILLSALETMIAYSIPFFTVIAFAGSGQEAIVPTADLYVQILCLSMLTRYTALLIPTPGNTGAVETSGYLVFTTVASMVPSKIGWVVLIWRFITYYMYILSGIGINIYDIIRSAVRNKKRTKQTK